MPSHSLRRLVRPLLAALALVALAAAVTACGYESDEKEVVEGEPVKMGEVSYNVIFSRFLNPDDSEDASYLVGQPAPPPEETYFGVFFELQNEDEEAHALPDSFTIHDAAENHFESIPSESLYAFPLGGEIEAQEQIPVLDTTPYQGPIEGSLVLFLIPDTAPSDLPLVLEIPNLEDPEEPGEVDLDF
jgi:hypothetical protein